MSRLTFTVRGEAAPAGSKRAFHNKKTGKVMVTDANPKARPWKALVHDAAAAAMGDTPPFTGPLALDVVFYVRRPRGHYGTGKNAEQLRPAAPLHPTAKPDLLKLARGVEDAMTGVVYGDDSQIVAEFLKKAYTEDGRVRTEVTVTSIER